jgi:phenylalanyl-tRNA synthetase beta chain
MKFSLSWLKDHLDTQASLAEIVESLTKIGLEVEHVNNPADRLKDFVIAHVIEAKQHPNADRLRVCMVDAGNGQPVQVVCGAPNARTGLKSVFSPVGTYIPAKNITLTKGVIRGVESNGMLCSAFELELSNDHEGIIEVASDAPIGTRFVDYMGLNDPVIEINLTPNRPDATGVYGIARDLAAAGLGTLKEKPITNHAGSFACPVSVTLDLAAEDKHLAPLFALRLVRGVKNGPSPDWLQKRLKSIGLRPINALVDITNYITFDRGRPLHVFDADKVKGQIVVRRGRAGESIVALDGKTYKIEPAQIVICDDNGIESIAGIMGGEHSGCDEDTQNVLIESALWDPMNIARSGRALGINSDARYRFERGIDPAFCLPGAQLATQMVLDLCGGEASHLHIAGKEPDTKRLIDFPFSEVARLTGLKISSGDMLATLKTLGFIIVSADDRHAEVSVPSWRPDVEGKADLVEEIMRIAGVDNVTSVPLPRLEASVPKPILTLLQKRTRLARRALAGRGLVEAVTWSFVSKEKASLFGGGQASLALANPIAADLSDMRPSLLPGLLAAAQRNADRALGNVAVFEVGQVFRGDGEKDQRMNAAGLRRAQAKPNGAGRHWSGAAGQVDVFDAKADASALLGSLNVPIAGLQLVAGGPAWFHPGRSATLQFGPKNIIGHFGEIHPAIMEALDLSGTIVAFELVLDDIPPPKLKPTKVKSKLDLPELMPVERDFAFLVDRSVKTADLIKAALSADRTMISDALIFDVYEGTGVPEGKTSIGLAITLQPQERTLTDQEIEAVAGKIVAEVSRKTGAILRG